jgi:periplasmic divalent cation tolerance protein
MVLIYTTCKNTEEAVKLGNALVTEHRAACVNIWPIQSMYLEGETLKNQLEAAMLVKTLEPKTAEIESFIAKNHTYATPFVGTIDVKRLNREYKEWMGTVVR